MLASGMLPTAEGSATLHSCPSSLIQAAEICRSAETVSPITTYEFAFLSHDSPLGRCLTRLIHGEGWDHGRPYPSARGTPLSLMPVQNRCSCLSGSFANTKTVLCSDSTCFCKVRQFCFMLQFNEKHMFKKSST
ncbi:uncharacterized protein [Lolium perenne]|uniref:uncharacterized protein isoform X2 n=1 Tax=Lolium perenne TaxID=4522 RepID=UPI0021F53E04|nr:uncharacterized protein LOC127333519 isoform X2 [Lolium perenne]